MAITSAGTLEIGGQPAGTFGEGFEIKAGSPVALSGLGTRYNGQYFVTKTTHQFGSGGSSTSGAFTGRTQSQPSQFPWPTPPPPPSGPIPIPYPITTQPKTIILTPFQPTNAMAAATLRQWLQECSNGRGASKPITIVVRTNGMEKHRIQGLGRPVPQQAKGGGEVAMEELVIQLEG